MTIAASVLALMIFVGMVQAIYYDGYDPVGMMDCMMCSRFGPYGMHLMIFQGCPEHAPLLRPNQPIKG